MEYQYQAFNDKIPSIRLLNLMPHHVNGELAVDLQRASLEHVNDGFSALSYTWGTDVPTRRIWIDGEWMLIRENLWQFLNHCTTVFFSKRGPMRLWVDAICINQEDISEKNSQVRMMSDIFASASEVLIWLGPPSKATAFAEDWEEFCKNGNEHRQGQYYKQLEARTTPQAFYLQYKDIVDDVWKISTSCYWDRLWIQQEIFLARRASIITHDTTWDIQQWQNEDLSLCLRHPDYQLSSELYKPAEQTKILLSGRLGKTPLILKALQHCSNKKCSDIRDKVFGLLAMSRGRYRNFEVNYNWTVEEVAKKTLPLIIEEMKEHVQETPIRTSTGGISQAPIPVPAYWLQISLEMNTSEFISATSLAEVNESNFGDLQAIPKEDIPYVILVGGMQMAYIDQDHPLHSRMIC